MALPTPKELKQLAAACRKAGIVHFKTEGIEFTLGSLLDKKPKKVNKNNTNNSAVISEGDWDSLSEIDKLMWSSATLPEVSPSNES